MSKKDGILDLTIKKYWFEKIKSGEKTHEYRNTATWSSRFKEDNSAKYHTVRFRQGQMVKSTNENRVLYGKIKSITVKDGKKTDLKINHSVYDIEFELIENKNNNQN